MEMEDEELITLPEVCTILKMKPAGVYGLVFRRKIPCVKLSRHCLRFIKSEIYTWIQAKTQAANQPTEPKPVQGSRKRGRPRKSTANTSYVNSLVEQARKEVSGHE